MEARKAKLRSAAIAAALVVAACSSGPSQEDLDAALADVAAAERQVADLRDLAVKNGEPVQISGKQELMENLINDAIVRGC